MREFIWAVILLLVIAVYFLSGCATDLKRERIQKEYPDCEVTEDYEIRCPNPFGLTHP